MASLLINPDINDILGGQKYLIINAPAVDTRLPWAAWHHPYGPLLIGTELSSRGKDVRFIDALHSSSEGKIPRTKINTFEIDGYKIDNWQFGTPPGKIINILQRWIKEGWSPDVILISCAISYWWPATSDLIHRIKKQYGIPVYLGGGYPTAYPEHAIANTEADFVISGNLTGISCQATDFSLYKPLSHPLISAVRIFASNETGDLVARPKESFVHEILEKAKLGVSKFILFDEWISIDQYQSLKDILASVILSNPRVLGNRLKPLFIAPGNISPKLIDKDLAVLFRDANFRTISFHDDISHGPYDIQYPSTFEDYRNSVAALHGAGYKPRTEQIDAAVLIGLPNENITDLAKRVIELSSIVGSVHLVPYQFTPNNIVGNKYADWLSQHNGHLDLSHLNGKLYPLARLAGAKLEEYWELNRLVALLNSKYHNHTFDFSSDSLVSNMVRNSLNSRLWDPFYKKVQKEEVSQ